MNDELLGHIGPPEIHDATILTIEQISDVVRVNLRTQDNHPLTIEFSGVAQLIDKDSKGMIVYALLELRTQSPLRRFVFVNWDEKSEASLEVFAKSWSVQ